jgi:hypothetical protein
VTKVEVSTDGGSTWKLAKLQGKPEKYGFRVWRYDWRAAAGSYQLMSRATNAAGKSQPLQEDWNPSGYLWNVSQKMPLEISANAPAQPAIAAAEPRTHPDGYQAACFGCHDEHMMTQQRLTKAQWDKEIGKMTGWGAGVKPEQRQGILDYLSASFKP